MKEIREIIRSYDELQKEGKRSALATVVHVEGSSYRRPGARMLIAEDGRLTGAISGGCLEGDAMRKALRVINEQRSSLVTLRHHGRGRRHARYRPGLQRHHPSAHRAYPHR